MSTVNKNLLQRGSLQKAFSISFYFLLIFVVAACSSWFQKYSLKNYFNTFNKNEISTETYDFTLEFINSVPLSENFIQLYVILLAVAAGFYLLQKSTELNFFCKKTKIASALEFSAAFNSINIIDPLTRIEFINKHKISVYKSASPLLADTVKELFGKYYPFMQTHIRSNTYLFHAIGSKTLFIDEEEFNVILAKESTKNLSTEEQMNYNKVLEKNKMLIKENKELEKNLSLSSAREKKSNIGNTVAFYLGHLGVPLIERLKHNGHHDMYTGGRIKDELIKTLESHGEVFESIIKGNTNPSKKEPKDFITSAHISIVKDALGEFAKKRGKPPINKTF